MNKGKLAGAVLLLIAALGAAGYSLYRTYGPQPTPYVSPEDRAKAMETIKAFEKKPAAK